MTRRMALSRIIFGFGLIALVYAGPYAYGLTTAADKVPECLGQAQTPQDVVVKLSFIPGPSQIEELQRYGRYGGSGDDLQNVVLLGVPVRNVNLLARLYWVERVYPTVPC
jgi:hypothetical protein